MYKINDKNYPCNISLAMKFIGGKWKTVILMHLIGGEKRYNALKKLIPTMTERTLSLQLKQLEEDKLIKRKVQGDKPPLKVNYSMTEFGESLIPVLQSISNWGGESIKYCERIEMIDEVGNQSII